MFGLLIRLLLFALLIWVARALLVGFQRAFRSPSERSRVRGSPPKAPVDSPQGKLHLSEDDVIDVPYTEVDPKREESRSGKNTEAP